MSSPSEPEPSQRDDPVEAGALEEEGDVPAEERPPERDEPVESGALEEEPDR